MAYTVLARKYRSQTFDEIAGQDALATTLSNAVESGRVHHGYLFTGTRGVGKTSMARILAKSLNCLSVDAPTASPCRECESCRLISEGEDIDVVEIDAASNTGVDNIRDLRNNAVFRPARSRFKIYIIDEVHMLSTGAFNALLKTLEEPPPHVKFILATTEMQKVPATIQSRCQRFDFRSIDVDTIAAQLRRILAAEQVEAEETVIRRVARLANGSMRDALSLLDQLLAFGAGKLDEALVEEILPTPHDEIIFELLDCVAGSDPAGALHGVERFLSSGRTAERFCEALLDHLRTLMVLAVCGEETDLADVPGQLRIRLAAQAGRFDAATYVFMIALGHELRRAVKSSGSSRALLDAAVVRLAMSEQFSDIKAALSSMAGTPAATAPAAQPLASPRQDQPAPKSTSQARSPKSTDSPSGQRSTAATPAPAPACRPNVKTADRDQVMADPIVRKAMDLFSGSLVDVRASAEAAAVTDDRSEAADDAEGAN